MRKYLTTLISVSPAAFRAQVARGRITAIRVDVRAVSILKTVSVNDYLQPFVGSDKNMLQTHACTKQKL